MFRPIKTIIRPQLQKFKIRYNVVKINYACYMRSKMTYKVYTKLYKMSFGR